MADTQGNAAVDLEAVLDMVAKARELGIYHVQVDDPTCHSVYIRDPDGDIFEIAYQRPGSIDALENGDAHEKLTNWLALHGDKAKGRPASLSFPKSVKETVAEFARGR